ncbi:hypothetical protein LXM94_11695 [Rhizobium sp. TRM95111]|uniref:hypothetical protein n=1 Tax=Rhizobium alarense TaxID=2846851 RepID=UPI001F28AFBE|nr:hypothetical protein [Rhizobium alarense]MCF3640627.1 hypothetical protein [Rhizobium alarense]
MRRIILAALAAALCHASFAAAEDRPAYDPAVAKAAIAILQKKLPEMRGGYGVTDTPAIVRRAEDEATPQGISALVDLDRRPSPAGRIVWL